MSAVDGDPLERLRALCLALPQVTERLSHGEPTWFAGGRKVFVTFADHHHDDRLGFWCAAPPGSQIELVTSDPQRFFVPPYVGGRGWIGVRLDVGDVDWTRSPRSSRTPIGRSPRSDWSPSSTSPPADHPSVRVRHADAGATALAAARSVRDRGIDRPKRSAALYDSGNGWPVAVFGEDGVIPGCSSSSSSRRRSTRRCRSIDEVEDTATDLLRRIEITTVDGAPAWAYHYPHDVDGLARIERWADQVDR